MQDKTTICWHTHRGIWLLERVQSYMVQTGFLYVNCFDHIKLDHGLIHSLIERWRRETHMFHLKHGKMTPTLQDVMILLGLPIDRMTVISTGVYNRIMLYERMIGLTPPSSKSKGGNICFKSIKETFSTPPDDGDEKVLWRYKINYDLNMLIICYNCVNYYDNFNLIVGMSEHIYFISLALYYLLTSQRYMFHLLYLMLPRNFDVIPTYSWGYAVLTSLYSHICLACMKRIKHVEGCLLLLQV